MRVKRGSVVNEVESSIRIMRVSNMGSIDRETSCLLAGHHFLWSQHVMKTLPIPDTKYG